jgi:hypothetical protein
MSRALLLCVFALACQPPIKGFDGGISVDGGSSFASFSLSDVNPNSKRSGQQVGPSSFSGLVTGWYFGHSSWSYCRSQFGFLNQIQSELETEQPGAFQLIGVNGIGFESSNSLMTDGRVLPWLQDVSSVDLWTQWNVTYRDVIVFSKTGERKGVYNLTMNDLSSTSNREALKTMLKDAAK